MCIRDSLGIVMIAVVSAAVEKIGPKRGHEKMCIRDRGEQTSKADEHTELRQYAVVGNKAEKEAYYGENSAGSHN